MSIGVAVIGATGSVGASVLDICGRFPERFRVLAVAADTSAEKLLGIAKRFNSSYACLVRPKTGDSALFAENGVHLLCGRDGLVSVAELPDVEHVVFASSGTDAISALQRALICDKNVSLANKESIVAAGAWVMPLVRRPDQIRPVDSEHSAVWQCLRDEPANSVRRITLTASGGPFREWSKADMEKITPEDALRHPVWAMGAKITIDSATLMNKGIECIEAMQLFGLPHSSVGALIHPKSQVHGIVLFSDGTMKMLFSRPDMRLPAAAALAWPQRLELEDGEFGIPPLSEWALDFYEPDTERFPCFALAKEAARMGGAYPPILIGADEFAVKAFLERRIPFTGISNIIEHVLESYSGSSPSSSEDAIELISWGERRAEEICRTMEDK